MKMPNIPCSLYIHMPWCVKKCPYCDFNSHALHGDVPEQAYIQALIADLDNDINRWPQIVERPIGSIFFGGGTPSLFSAAALEQLLEAISERLKIATDSEITLEANPGTYEHDRFSDYRRIGINRISLGVQSFQDDKLKQLGRIHHAADAKHAAESLHAAGFDNFNIDLMHGLPEQTAADALFDLETAIACQPTHLSWYQLTIEPNTVFYKQTPMLPDEETLEAIEQAGWATLKQAGFEQYEVSAYAKAKLSSQHNMNYWLFGDYLGIGAGAHGKFTNPETAVIERAWKVRQPKDYLNQDKAFIAQSKCLTPQEHSFEFMLNALRLTEAIPFSIYTERTGLPIENIIVQLKAAENKGLIELSDTHIKKTALGRRFLNEITALFLEQ